MWLRPVFPTPMMKRSTKHLPLYRCCTQYTHSWVSLQTSSVSRNPKLIPVLGQAYSAKQSGLVCKTSKAISRVSFKLPLSSCSFLWSASICIFLPQRPRLHGFKWLPEFSHATMSTECLQPVAILWDIENCAIPKDVKAEDVALHIRLALKVKLAMKGPIIVFSAYGDFSQLPQHTRQGCHNTGVNLIDIPHGKKDSADKAILVDMFLFALDNPPPCTLVLISGDVDFAPALHKLRQRGYCVVLAIPTGPQVSPALCNACQHLWMWPDVAHGKGLNLVKTPSLCMIDQAKGKGQVEANHHGFNNIKAGPSSNQNGSENCVVQAAAVVTPKLSKKQRKACPSSNQNGSGNCVVQAASVVTPKLSKKKRKAARLAVLPADGILP